MRTKTERTLEQTQQGVSDEVLSDTKVFTMTMEMLPEPTSNKLCAVKPCQGDSLEFYQITGSIYTHQRGTVVIAIVIPMVAAAGLRQVKIHSRILILDRHM
ncbi:hypothetical protein Tco_0079112 [Tanacetum coccineum]